MDEKGKVLSIDEEREDGRGEKRRSKRESKTRER